MAVIITHTKNWLHDAYKVRHLSIVIREPNWEESHILLENLLTMSIFPALTSIFPWREPSYAARVLWQSWWSSLPTLPTSENSEMYLRLTAHILHFSCAPLASSFYKRLLCSFMPSNLLAEKLQWVKHLHKVCFYQCHYPFLSSERL